MDTSPYNHCPGYINYRVVSNAQLQLSLDGKRGGEEGGEEGGVDGEVRWSG